MNELIVISCHGQNIDNSRSIIGGQGPVDSPLREVRSLSTNPFEEACKIATSLGVPERILGEVVYSTTTELPNGSGSQYLEIKGGSHQSREKIRKAIKHLPIPILGDNCPTSDD